jgi:hypothetical protein
MRVKAVNKAVLSPSAGTAIPLALHISPKLRRYTFRRVMRNLFILVLLFFSKTTMALEISNFESGLACTDGKSFGWICHVTEEINITGQGQCIWSGENKPCTWYGFQFSFKDYKIGADINCEYRLSEPTNEGNFEGVRSENAQSGTFSFQLKEEEGHYYNPQYFLLSIKEKDSAEIRVTTICKYEGEIIFSYEINANFPISE